jgi:hypothetical protein
VATTLFAFRVPDDDALLDLLDDVADAGVRDSEWDWLVWLDARDRIYGVVRGSLGARGAFHASKAMRSVRLSTAVERSEDNRAQWDEPSNASEGRDLLAQWVSSSGIEPLEPEVITAALPKPAPPTAPSTLVLRGRERLQQQVVPFEPGESSSPRNGGRDSHQNRGGNASGRGRSDGSSRKKSDSNSVLEAFGAAVSDSADSTGKKFTLYRMDSAATDASVASDDA